MLRRRAYNHRWAVQPPGVIPLTAADPDFPVCADIIDAVQRHLATGYVPYGPAEGLPELRHVATDRLRGRYGLRCDADTLLPTDGAASAIFLVTRHALPAAGDEAIIPDPVDFLLERAVRAAGGVVRRWPTANGRYDATQLEALVTRRTRLISLCNPHNPLGRVLRREELEAIADVALRHNLWILADEVWSDIVYPPHSHVCMATLDRDVAARTFTVFGFSKSYGLAGMRLGLLATPDAAQRRRIMTLAHAEDTAYGASTISQVAGAAAYELGDAWLQRFVAHLRRRRDQAVSALVAMPGVRCASPEGTFVAFPDVSGLGIDERELAGRLLEHDQVAVVPGTRAFFGPGAGGHLRLSFATSRGILAEGLERIAAGLQAVGNEQRAVA
jgi:aspartate/methionine/tyrosine aminotransferase